jgi:hypothetical protein
MEKIQIYKWGVLVHKLQGCGHKKIGPHFIVPEQFPLIPMRIIRTKVDRKLYSA